MELLIPDGAETLASYDHYNWKGHAAVTKNCYGKGKAVYLGCMMDAKVLEKVLTDSLRDAKVEIPRESFPVIVRNK